MIVFTAEARVSETLCRIALVVFLQSILLGCTSEPLPAWVSKAILERENSGSRDVIEEATFNGVRAFLLHRGDRADTGDEHVLFDEDGSEICQFGGFAGRVSAGACNLEQIIYVRTLYPGSQP
jgi:hypothetical protein